MLKNIAGNVQEDCGECSNRFLGMLKKIWGNVSSGSGQVSKSSW